MRRRDQRGQTPITLEALILLAILVLLILWVAGAIG